MKTVINTPKAPAPIGPYNQAILVGNILYISGQIALHPKTMQLVSSSIAIETKQVMENLKAVLEAANMTFEKLRYVSERTEIGEKKRQYSPFKHLKLLVHLEI